MTFKRKLLLAVLPFAFSVAMPASALDIKFAEIHPAGYPTVVAEQNMGKNLKQPAMATLPSRCLPAACWARKRK